MGDETTPNTPAEKPEKTVPLTQYQELDAKFKALTTDHNTATANLAQLTTQLESLTAELTAKSAENANLSESVSKRTALDKAIAALGAEFTVAHAAATLPDLVGKLRYNPDTIDADVASIVEAAKRPVAPTTPNPTLPAAPSTPQPPNVNSEDPFAYATALAAATQN